MSRKPNPRVIGAFLIGALFLLIVAISVLGSGALFRKSRTFVIFFDSNVSGLDVGATVNFRGVRVGTVSDIVLVVNPKNYEFKIKVLVDIEQDRIQRSIPDITGESAIGLYRILLDRGLKAQLRLDSFVTGKQYVGLDFYPDVEAVFFEPESDLLEIPSVQTSSEQLQRSLAEVIENLKAADIKQLVLNFQSVLASLDSLLSSGDLHDSISKLNVALGEINNISQTLGARLEQINVEMVATMDGVQALVANLNDSITTLSTDMRGLTGDARYTLHAASAALELKEGVPGDLAADILATSEQARRTLESLDRTLADLRGSIAPGSPAMHQLEQALAELTPMLRSIRRLTETLEQNPQAILYGIDSNE